MGSTCNSGLNKTLFNRQNVLLLSCQISRRRRVKKRYIRHRSLLRQFLKFTRTKGASHDQSFDLPYTIIIPRGESTGKSFRFPVVTPHLLPIDRLVNDHSFYWYVQTTNIEMFSAFINAFSNRFRVSADPLDQHGRLLRSHWSSISYAELSFVAHFSLHTKKNLARGICYTIIFGKVS